MTATEAEPTITGSDGPPTLPPGDDVRSFGGGEYRGFDPNAGSGVNTSHRLISLIGRSLILSFAPSQAPAHMSEHFGHAQKRNELTPAIANPHG